MDGFTNERNRIKMSKSKEESINIINKEFDDSNNKKEAKSLFLALEKSIKDISNSEFSLVWLIDYEKKKIKTLHKNRDLSLDLEASILESVFLSKKAFFDNYVVSHQKYNQKIDNILNVKIKSILVVPVLDKRTGEVVACSVAFNSVHHKGEFKRYDARSLGLLEQHIFDLIKMSNDEPIVTVEREVAPVLKEKKEPSLTIENTTPRVLRKTKVELEAELKIEQEKVRALENELLLKTQALKMKEQEIQEYIPTVVEDEDGVLTSDVYTVLDFLTNEVRYLANEEHKIHLFLEIIKNSLHNKEQLHFLNSELEKTQLIEQLATKLYTREKMPVVLEQFNIYQLINDITLLYGQTLADKNITLNVFLNPTTPNFLHSDRYKIKSLIVHLMNNVFNFTNEGGAIEISIAFSDTTELLSIEIKGIKQHQSKETKRFFKNQQTSHSLTSSDRGLGLSVSSNLINILSGKLKLSTLGENEHLFTVLLPMKKGKEERRAEFLHPKVMKVAILMNEENRYALDNLVRYLIAMGVDEKFIVSFQSSKKMSKIKFSHLFCFENMFSSELQFKNFSSVVILKYSQKPLTLGKNQKSKVDELSINSYYGSKLQNILFPNMQKVELIKNTLLVEDSFLNKFSNVLKRLKFS